MNDIAPKMELDSSVYKTLLESTKAIPWKIDWATMQFTYIGPQIEGVLGWPQDSWVSVNDWASRIHPDEREAIVNFCVAQSQAGADHEADYRALAQNGDYVWIRDVVHVARKPDGSVDALIGFMFDINERKKTEAKLIDLQKELETLSFKDGLTGVANRRMFDSVMKLEWANAKNDKRPISVIMLDIDYFKQYNDHYGHIQGDHCLRQVAQTLSSAASRSRDFFGRFGGEEFILILPETNELSALTVAERCRKLIADEQIVHEKSGIGQRLTISLGVHTVIPCYGDEPLQFIEEVDRRLYRAKQKGRDCIASDT